MISSSWLMSEWYRVRDWWVNDIEFVTGEWMISSSWLMSEWYWVRDYWVNDIKFVIGEWMISSESHRMQSGSLLVLISHELDIWQTKWIISLGIIYILIHVTNSIWFISRTRDVADKVNSITRYDSHIDSCYELDMIHITNSRCGRQSE